LTGDYLSAHASLRVSRLGPEAARIVAETFAAVVTGQMRESRGVQSTDPVEHYLQVAREKTGSLIGACCRFGGMFSGACRDHVEQLARFGTTAGIAVQISEDLLAASRVLAPPGTEPAGRAHALLEESAAGEDERRELLAGPVTAGAVRVPELLSDSRGIELATDALRCHAGLADAELSALPGGYAVDGLRRFVRDLVERVE
jgi:heptaprenyl diphosphate synthase